MDIPVVLEPAGLRPAGSPAGSLGSAFRQVTRALLSAAFLFAAGLFAAAFIGHIYGYTAFSVLSGSMRPTLPVGSLVVTRPVDVASLKVGDIVTFHPPAHADVVVTHRIVAREYFPPYEGAQPTAILTTKGDANTAPDSWRLIAGGQTVQRHVFHIPGLGYVLAWALTRTGVMTLMFAPAILLAIGLLMEVWRRPDPLAARGPAR